VFDADTELFQGFTRVAPGVATLADLGRLGL